MNCIQKLLKKYDHLLHHRHRLPALIATLALIVGGWFFFQQADMTFDPAGMRIEIIEQGQEVTYLSPEVETADFNAWFVRFRATDVVSDWELRVRPLNAKKWHDWQMVAFGDDADDLGIIDDQQLSSGFVSVPLADAYQFRVTARGEMGAAIEIEAIETQDTRTNSLWQAIRSLFPAAHAQLSDLSIISRADWQADPRFLLYDPALNKPSTGGREPTTRELRCEQLQKDYPNEFRMDNRRFEQTLMGEQLHWPRTYSKEISKIIVHHTASKDRDINGDDVFDAQDSAGLVRAIYYRHAVFNGWGDVGYQFLIDPFGNIYEGRDGGDFVIAAHAYCANIGTIGVALLGDFTEEEPTTAALDALAQLTGELSNVYDVDPLRDVEWHGVRTPGIAAHRDYGQTSCPGVELYAALPELREDAANYARANKPSDKAFDYRVLASESPIHLAPLHEQTVHIKLKNIGQQGWPAGGVFRTSSPDQSGTVLKNGAAAFTLPHRVSAGNEMSLTIPIQAGVAPGRYRFDLVPDFAPDMRKLFVVVTVSTPTLDYEFISAKHPPFPFAQGDTAEVQLQLRNKSSVTWRASGANHAFIGGISPEERTSPFTESNELAQLASDTAPGEVGVFRGEWIAPDRAGRYEEAFAPAIAGLGYMQDYGMQFNVTVREPRFASNVIKKSSGAELNFRPGESKELFVEIKNTSQLTWNADHFSLLEVRNQGVTWDKAAAVLTRDVAPGERVRIPIHVTAPPRGGRLVLSLRPRWTNGRTRTIQPINFPITVRSPELTAEIVDAPLKIWMAEGGETSVTIAYRNTGTFDWTNTGDHPVRLGTYQPQDRTSDIYHASWQAPTRPATLTEAVVQPDEIGHFTFLIQKNASGRQDEYFAPVMDGVGWMVQDPVRLIVLPSRSGSTRVEQAKVNTEVELVASSPLPASPSRGEELVAPEPAPVEIVAPEPPASGEAVIAPAPAAGGPDIRIRLSFSGQQVDIGGDLIIKNMNGHEVFRGGYADFHAVKMKNGQFYRVEPVGGTILEIANWAHHPGWTDTINDNKYRGIIEIRKLNGELIVINELPLEAYIRGIAEPLPTDPPEKAKLLSILARSYALYYTDPAHRKFAGQPYDGSDNPAEFQKYLGYNYELRGNMPEAADQTRGQVAMHRGAVVKTPYFTSSGGQTKTPQQARWNAADFAFAVSVSDPWSCGLDSSAIGTSFSCPENAAGHGVGASGTGMTGLAKEGETATEILEYFFDGLVIEQVY